MAPLGSKQTALNQTAALTRKFESHVAEHVERHAAG
jgi:hypothetical protein